ncbi:MAG: hypothetical protein IIA11_02685 [Proteobacteria bacterium]|nr:hypothetical protein [Pseudomonadota bacterium]
MNLYHVHVALRGEHPAIKTNVYARTAVEAIAGCVSTFEDADAVSVSCYLQERDVAILRGGLDVLHADCFP